MTLTSKHSLDTSWIGRTASHHGTITKALADAAYDSKNNFSFMWCHDVVPGIKVRKNSSGRSNGCYPRKVSVISQLDNLQY